MECFSRCGLVVPMRIAEHVERDTVVDVLLGANTIDNTQNGPSYNSSAAMYPEKSARPQSR